MPNIEQHEEKPKEMAANDRRQARFFMTGGLVEWQRVQKRQQQEVSVATTSEERTIIIVRIIMAYMLESPIGLAMKKKL